MVDLLKTFKKVVNKVKDTLDEVAETDAKENKLQRWKKALARSQTEFSVDAMDQREYIYLGSHGVDSNINTAQRPSKLANTVYNIVFEFIETQVNTQIPQPSVKSVREGYEEQAHMIEDSIADKLKQMDTEEVTDVNERITPVQGYSIMELCWNNDYHHHLYTGDMELYSRHPKQFIPQPGVFRIKHMDYFFVLCKVTREYIKRRYKVDLGFQSEQYPENTNLYGVSQQGNTSAEEHSLTECTAWYKDEEGDVCKYVWINDTELEDLPKYYYRRDPETGEVMMTEVLMRDQPIGMTQTVTDVSTDPQTLQPIQTQRTEPMVIPAGTEVPMYIPDSYPFIIRRNVPKNFSLGGQSDLDVIRDHQDTIKKVLTKTEEKVIKSGSAVLTPDDMTTQITDAVYQSIRGTAQQLSLIKTIDLKADITQDVQYLEIIYKQAQSMLGITDSFQGKEDPSAKSGVAKQIQVQQASGRLQSKQFNKNAAFKELFELMFQLMLAFYDEPRPYTAKDEYGNTRYAEFDKYKFLMMDANGEFYYNTDFLFSSDVGSGLPKDPIFMYNQVKEMLAAGAIDQLQYWTILEYLNFPMAKQIKAQIEQKQQMQQVQMQAEQAAMSAQGGQPPKASFDNEFMNLSPEQQQMFNSLPQDERIAIRTQLESGAA
jgi:hypothetical protein